MDPRRIRVLGMVLLLLFGSSILYIAAKNHTGPSYKDVNSFEDCVKAGNAVHKGSPPICITVEGESFIENQN